MTSQARLVEPASAELALALERERGAATTAFAAATAVAPRLGALPTSDGHAAFVFWAPDLVEARIPAGDIFLEVLEPETPLDLAVSRQTVSFRRQRVPLLRRDELVLGVVEGLTFGTRQRLGSFYALAWRDRDGEWRRRFDPMAHSLPFGVMAPAELYDLASIDRERGDRGYWQNLASDGVTKLGPAAHILQIHVPTATAGGTLASLERRFKAIARKLEAGHDLTPDETVFAGYDAVQLLPVEPTTVYETGPEFWVEADDAHGPAVAIELRRPDTTNWGYDVVILGSAAVSPTLLESGRPDELADLAATLHSFPGRPIRLILDVVYGHSDNQGLACLPHQFFAGPNMYGQNLDYQNPWVRASLLEMQRRKVDFGADGVRVDGAQDFKWWDADAQVLRHDDAYLQSMSDIVQEVAGCRYRPWMIFEDGRPWPEEDWELSSTYRAVIERQTDDDVFQWGPLTFAHNTPFVYGFWLARWWRIRQMLDVGENWISGCANHDTLRRGTQVSPKLNINTRLGATRMEILDKAYDNPAVDLLTYAAFPGVPMDFLNAAMRASWGFIRNQDDRYGVKVVAEEAVSLDWQVDEETYDKPAHFKRLKALGFSELDELRRFMRLLPALVEATDYDLDAIALLLRACDPPLAGRQPLDVRELKIIAKAWMDDMHDYCHVDRYAERLSPTLTAFDRELRRFRTDRPWLRRNFGSDDWLRYRDPVAGNTLLRWHRHSPDGSEAIFGIVNLEGAPVSLDPTRHTAMQAGDWHVALRTPPIGSDYLAGPITLGDSMGVVFTAKQ
jgi:hypothetical protein